jgi:Domain of unknown function (DUF4335)
MTSSNSVLRRYTPPTCTLEIAAKGSPLSRWVGRPALKQLQFQLSLDDPRLPEDKRLSLRGDKTQLEELREAVEAYVQDFLGQSNGLRQPPTALKPTNDTNTASEQPPDNQTAQPEPEAANLIPDDTLEEKTEVLPASPENAAPITPLPTAPNKIYLQPNGLLAHNLFLGSLATPESGPGISLSTLQLFDLATALSEYAEEMVALPTLNPAQKKGFVALLQAPPAWAKTAALLLLTIGATAAAIKLLDRNAPNAEIATSTSPAATPTEQSPVAVAPLPSPSPILPTPPVSSSQLLPTPPVVGSTATPSPGGLPTVGVPASPSPNIPSTLEPLGATNPNSLQPFGSPTSPLASPGASTARTSPPAPYRFPTGSNPSPSPTRRQTTAATPSPTQPLFQQNTPAPQRNTPAPTPRRETSAATTPNRRTEQAVASSNPTPTFFPRPGQNPQVAASRPQSPAAIPTPSPQTPPSIPAPATIESPPLLPTPTAQANSAEPPVATLRSAPTAKPEANSSPGAAADSNNAGFDPIPQVAEVRKYFQQRWQPPASLTQNIEYSLSINPDGSIKSVIPRGQTAEIYLDRTEVPLPGEPFVSPIEGGRNATIIVVLSKDGKVEAFLQPPN